MNCAGLIFLFVICQVSSTELKSLYSDIIDECSRASKVDDGIVEDAFNGMLAYDKNLKTFINCFFQKSGFQDDDGNVRYDMLKSFFRHFLDSGDFKDFKEILITCQGKNFAGENAAETAFLHFKCIFGQLNGCGSSESN